MRHTLRCSLVLSLLVLSHPSFAEDQGVPVKGEERPPVSEMQLRDWLRNMVWHHHFSTDEIRAATGLSETEVSEALKRWDITASNRPSRDKNAPLLVLPYPGGRHPRIGFLEGAVGPQRETKVSIFTPWDQNSYVVADVPEAIWCQHGLLYLAHTHVPTMWSKQNVALEKLEWTINSDGMLICERTLPNKVSFGTEVMPHKDHVRMRMWLQNGSSEELKDLRVQNCVMLKGAQGFQQLNNDNKRLQKPYAVCRSEDGKHWIITAWSPCHRSWANAKCPCLHSDPKFPDCPPGKTAELQGWLSFYDGEDIDGELRRIDQTGWMHPRFKDTKD
ncbi:MAG: hypothetical protein U0903_03455 [Planctomycetales bacterium]